MCHLAQQLCFFTKSLVSVDSASDADVSVDIAGDADVSL